MEDAKGAVSSRDRLNGKEVIRRIQDKGRQASFISTNVTKDNEVKILINALKVHFGRIELLVNNAGVILSRPLIEIEDEEWDWVISVNVTITNKKAQV